MLRFVTILMFVATLLLARAAFADDRSTLLAQACYLEATWNHRDCSAITYVLLRRAKRTSRTVEQMTHAYSLNKDTPRAAYARRLPAGLGPNGLKEWSGLVAVVEGVLSSRIKDPCRGHPTHWGSPHKSLPDLERAAKAIREGRWVEARCGTVANRFYIERRAPKTVSAKTAAGESQ